MGVLVPNSFISLALERAIPKLRLSRITNILAVKYFGEAEFWLSIGKIFLIMLLFSFTFVTMCGGNPQGHAYGFSNWSKPV